MAPARSFSVREMVSTVCEVPSRVGCSFGAAGCRRGREIRSWVGNASGTGSLAVGAVVRGGAELLAYTYRKRGLRTPRVMDVKYVLKKGNGVARGLVGSHRAPPRC